MNVVPEDRLREFGELHARARSSLNSWLTIVKQAEWRKFADVKATYRSADQVGRFTVFNLGGNNFRLIAIIDYDSSTVFVRDVLTHAEYDKDKWNDR